MLGDVTGNERAERLHRQLLRAREVEQAAHQRRADAFAVERRRYFGVQDGDGTAVAVVVGKRNMAVGVELEAVAFGVVADGVGHGRRLNTLGARRQGARAERFILLPRTRRKRESIELKSENIHAVYVSSTEFWLNCSMPEPMLRFPFRARSHHSSDNANPRACSETQAARNPAAGFGNK